MRWEKECLKKGLLKKIEPNKKKAENSIRLAELKLETAKKEFDAGIFDGAFISTYTAMFHAGRALLFKDGYKERSHYCIYRYIADNYNDKIETRYIEELNSFRTIRHSIMYGDEEEVTPREVIEEEADSAIKVAKGFLEVVKKLLKE